MSGAFYGWQSNAFNSQRLRKTTTKIIQRWKNVSLSHTWDAWVAGAWFGHRSRDIVARMRGKREMLVRQGVLWAWNSAIDGKTTPWVSSRMAKRGALAAWGAGMTRRKWSNRILHWWLGASGEAGRSASAALRVWKNRVVLVRIRWFELACDLRTRESMMAPVRDVEEAMSTILKVNARHRHSTHSSCKSLRMTQTVHFLCFPPYPRYQRM
jgi:hypothetical protein